MTNPTTTDPQAADEGKGVGVNHGLSPSEWKDRARAAMIDFKRHHPELFAACDGKMVKWTEASDATVWSDPQC